MSEIRCVDRLFGKVEGRYLILQTAYHDSTQNKCDWTMHPAGVDVFYFFSDVFESASYGCFKFAR